MLSVPLPAEMEKPRSLGCFCPGWLQIVKLIILKAPMSHFPTPHPPRLEPSPVPPLCHGSAGSLAAEAHKSLWRFLRTWAGLTASLSRLGCFFFLLPTDERFLFSLTPCQNVLPDMAKKQIQPAKLWFLLRIGLLNRLQHSR